VEATAAPAAPSHRAAQAAIHRPSTPLGIDANGNEARPALGACREISRTRGGARRAPPTRPSHW